MQLKRRKKPNKSEIVLKRRKKPERPVLRRRPRPDVYYCARKEIKNRLPYPIECSWVGEMYECCKVCKKKIIYSLWKTGGYIELNKQLKNRTYKPSEADIKAEEEISSRASGKGFT